MAADSVGDLLSSAQYADLRRHLNGCYRRQLFLGFLRRMMRCFWQGLVTAGSAQTGSTGALRSSAPTNAGVAEPGHHRDRDA